MIYVASSWRNPKQPEVVNRLRDEGFEVYDFRAPDERGAQHPDGTGGFHWSEIDPLWQQWSAEKFKASLQHPLAVAGFERDFKAMCDSDTCVMVLPCGRSAALELGYCAGVGKTTVILLDAGEPELMFSLADHICVSLDEVVEVLKPRPHSNDLSTVSTSLDTLGVKHIVVRDKLHSVLAEALRGNIGTLASSAGRDAVRAQIMRVLKAFKADGLIPRQLVFSDTSVKVAISVNDPTRMRATLPLSLRLWLELGDAVFTPQFMHHTCPSCIFLGRSRSHDFYYCTQGTYPTILARYSDLGPAYTSGMQAGKQLASDEDNAEAPLAMAYTLAMEKGLINEKDH